MKLEMLRPLAAFIVALGFVFAFDTAPASAQEKTPWYMPQPWVYPQQSGPKVRKLPGYYGHTYRNKSYGSFAKYCYGECGYRWPGTVSSSGGVILSRPTVAAFDPNAYQLVPRTLYVAPQPVAQRKAAKATVFPTSQQRGYKPKPTVRMQNGVRVIQLTPLTAN